MLFIYIILDAARLEGNLNDAKQLNKSFRCLYESSKEKIYQTIGPYIFSVKNSSPFYEWYMKNGWGNAWGLMIFSSETIDRLNDHFLKFKYMQDESGIKQYFRYYDPRVLKKFLPTCTKEELNKFFGPIEYFIVEGDLKVEAIKFVLENDKLNQEKISVSQVFGDLKDP